MYRGSPATPWLYVLYILVLGLPRCSGDSGTSSSESLAERGTQLMQWIGNLSGLNDSSQLIVVLPDQRGSSDAHVFALDRDAHGHWHLAAFPFTAIVGRSGVAAAGTKREGDGKTPSGIFALGPAFGSAIAISTKMPYRQAGRDDHWVDDPQSPDYNQWIHGPYNAASAETLARDDGLYDVAIVIGYNVKPIVAGNGSAIFMHIRRSNGKPTAGCVALSEGDLRYILGWLDPAKRPLILIRESFDQLADGTEAREIPSARYME